MAIYRRDQVSPEWEPVPWDAASSDADRQERGFHDRALKPIQWAPIPWQNFPVDGLFGKTRTELASVDATHFATLDDEDLLLIENTWSGFPDPPPWGLVSKRAGHLAAPWQHWGHFAELPAAWRVPGQV